MPKASLRATEGRTKTAGSVIVRQDVGDFAEQVDTIGGANFTCDMGKVLAKRTGSDDQQRCSGGGDGTNEVFKSLVIDQSTDGENDAVTVLRADLGDGECVHFRNSSGLMPCEIT